MQVNIKVTAILVVAAVGLTAFVFNQKLEDASRQNELSQLLSAAETATQSPAKNSAKDSMVNMPLPTTVQRNSMPPGHPPLGTSANNGHKVTSGAADNFLTLPTLPGWQSLEQGEGIASLKYRLTLDSDQQDMAVIRMNKEVPLDTVINIWKQKAGLGPDSTIKYQSFINNHEQSFYLTELKGPFKTILLAIHKDKKYTFFRLTGKNRRDDKALVAFKQFLSNAKIDA